MKSRAFTLIEILIVVTVLAIIAAVVTVGYSPFQKRAAASTTKNEIKNARSSLELFNGLERDYPPNLAGVDYVAPSDVVMTLFTNSPQVEVYTGMTVDQNAQLFLNSCNALMPIIDDGTTYNTSCSFAGKNIHVKGTKTSNIVFHGPTVEKADIALTCGAACDAAVAQMISNFELQGGTWPLSVPGGQVSLPDPTLVSNGKATKYCLEARYAEYDNVVFYMLSGDTRVQEGTCPSDPDLHYP